MARVRLFIAVDIEEEVRERIAALQEELARPENDVKWVDPASMHVTLLFLGEVAELDMVPICRVVAESTRHVPPFSMTVKGLGAFPTPRRPKILWAGLTEGADSLRVLHDKIEKPLLERGGYRREDRGYNPHLTLGRLHTEDRAEIWGPVLSKHADWFGGTTAVSEVLVMRSELRRDGPVYTVVGRGKLKGVPASEDEDLD